MSALFDTAPEPRRPERLLRLRDVKEKVGLATTTIYRFIDTQGFPAPLRIGPVASRWRESDIDAWVEARAALQPAPEPAPVVSSPGRPMSPATRERKERAERFAETVGNLSPRERELMEAFAKTLVSAREGRAA